MRKKTKKFKPPKLEINYDSMMNVVNNENIVLTNKILKEYKLQVDKTKIENFNDINFVSIFEE